MKVRVGVRILVLNVLLVFGQAHADPNEFIEGEFAFVRIQYDTYRSSGFGSSSWQIDFPDADTNFLLGVSRLTNIKVKEHPIVLRLDDEEIFKYPFLYALEMGNGGGPYFSEVEKENLREYLLRGGFLLIDDFWGTWQWEAFYRSFSQIFPEKELVEIKAPPRSVCLDRAPKTLRVLSAATQRADCGRAGTSERPAS
jgi:hypothetical protein